ncbi:MAG: glycine cleavage T C-terminal barrel domain-containing protein [Acidimicrobiia bacterium]|nr:glycine cleavage T C-terminal barrel domain-containing protein [Acidimicrobiia bacterium]
MRTSSSTPSTACSAPRWSLRGWEMPLAYGDGTIAEHLACRESAVAFDVSHLGSVRVSGTDATPVLQWALTNDLDKIGPGRAQYTHLLDTDDASVLDDIIVWWLDDTTFDVMPNASNTDRVLDALTSAATGRRRLHDRTPERAVVALQGPEAREVLAAVLAPGRRGRTLPGGIVHLGGRGEALVGGTGYTGEDGVGGASRRGGPELPGRRCWKPGTPGWAGAATPCDSRPDRRLRLRSLAGITPSRRVSVGRGLGKGDFRGREASRPSASAAWAAFVGLTVEGRRPPRAEQAVLVAGEVVGEATSGNFSPVLGHGIASRSSLGAGGRCGRGDRGPAGHDPGGRSRRPAVRRRAMRGAVVGGAMALLLLTACTDDGSGEGGGSDDHHRARGRDRRGHPDLRRGRRHRRVLLRGRGRGGTLSFDLDGDGIVAEGRWAFELDARPAPVVAHRVPQVPDAEVVAEHRHDRARCAC